MVKKEFEKLGVIHATASTFHGDTKRSRLNKNKTVETLESDSDAPFTTKPIKMKGKSIHEIVVKHEHHETPSSLSTNKTCPDSIGSSNEIRMLNDRIEVLNDLLKTFTPDDPEYIEFTKQKRTLLIKKLGILPTMETQDSFFSPTSR